MTHLFESSQWQALGLLYLPLDTSLVFPPPSPVNVYVVIKNSGLQDRVVSKVRNKQKIIKVRLVHSFMHMAHILSLIYSTIYYSSLSDYCSVDWKTQQQIQRQEHIRGGLTRSHIFLRPIVYVELL